MRKKISEIVLLVTGALLLAFSVLPHHHHNNRICFVSTEQCTTCHKSCDGSGHSHGGEDGDCDLKQLFMMSGRYDQAAQQQDFHPNGDWQHLLLFALFVTPPPSAAITWPQQARVKYPPFVEPLGSRCGGRAYSLRAPPVSIA